MEMMHRADAVANLKPVGRIQCCRQPCLGLAHGFGPAGTLRTQGGQRFSPEVLTNASGFAGIDGLFRFRSDGTNERGLAVMKVASGGATPVAGSPKSFGA